MTAVVSSPRAHVILLTCACAGTTALFYAFDPNRSTAFPTCPLYQRTGIYCAGCGSTRAVFALLHGRPLEALHDNLLLTLALPFLAWKLTGYCARAWQLNAWPETSIESTRLVRSTLIILGVLMAFMVLRNLPYPPFTFLAPIPPAMHFPGIRP